MSQSARIVLFCLLALAGCAHAPADEAESLKTLARSKVKGRDAPGDVRIRCSVKDAEVYLDGVLQGVCDDFDGEPSFLVVGSGEHRIEVRKPGHRTYRADVATGDAVIVLNVDLPPL